MVMRTRNLVQRDNTLEVTCSVKGEINETSPEFSISGCATFQLKAVSSNNCGCGNSYLYENMILVRFFKNCQKDDLSYSITLSSKKLCIVEKSFLSDDGTWHLIKENYAESAFDISVVMNTVHVSTFEVLHDDTNLTDFELRGEDGSVKIHKAILAACSPTFRTMFCGSWRETTEGHVNVAGTSALTLRHLKDYIYLGTLPDTGLEQILLLALYYMIPDLEQKCVNKLVDSLTAQNAYDLLEFAVKHKVTRLVLAILDCVRGGKVEVNDMRQYLLNC
ncbi:unnamed protein product [Parnassius mnemosyne]|uniref:BTB domain-containing protein n=1 Tax=Parnassius mnemosyne TaxID=213953 RepID=A0AAV1KQT6_9NEOP